MAKTSRQATCTRERQRQEIAEQIAQFLDSGGKIEQVLIAKTPAKPIASAWKQDSYSLS